MPAQLTSVIARTFQSHVTALCSFWIVRMIEFEPTELDRTHSSRLSEMSLISASKSELVSGTPINSTRRSRWPISKSTKWPRWESTRNSRPILWWTTWRSSKSRHRSTCGRTITSTPLAFLPATGCSTTSSRMEPGQGDGYVFCLTSSNGTSRESWKNLKDSLCFAHLK